LNASGRSTEDFVGIYDPATSSLRKLTLSGFTDPRGYNAHGMDVVQSSSTGHSSEIFVYLVNQRPPLDWDASKGDKVEFVNPSVEIFRMSALESGTLEHVKTIEHELIQSPNDVVGSPDGKSFWVTNDGSHARGFAVRTPFSLLLHRMCSNR
jgi:arylesterase/paraoxonase